MSGDGMFSARIPNASLASLCRALRHQMEAGLTLAQAFKQQGKKGPLAVRPVASRIAEDLAKGESLRDVLDAEKRHFPPIFLTLSAVAEESGQIPEVLRELEDYFDLQVTLWRQFLATIAWPVFQFVAATIVLALLIWLLGFIAEMRGEKPLITVFGLSGGTSALLFLVIVYGGIASLFGLYWFLKNVLERGPLVDGFLLQIPGIGGCLRSFALSRFSLGLALTMEAGTPLRQALKLSLEATSNAAFASQGAKIGQLVAKGETLHDALREAALFPEEYLASIDTAEVSGQEPEVLRKQAQIHGENAARSLKWLARAAGFLVWALVAAVIIFFIFSIAMQISGIYNQAFKDLGM